MKTGIAIHAFGGSGWIGGVYYFRNIAFQLLLNNKITQSFRIFIFTSPELAEEFSDLPGNIKILTDNNRKFDKIKRLIRYRKYHIKFVFPSDKDMRFLGIKTVSWIADFQHEHLPELFPEDDLENRRKKCKRIAKSGRDVVLSSKNAYRDFKKFYPEKKQNVFVVPFVSYLEPVIRGLTLEKEQSVLMECKLLNRKYACIANQFWRHKNHLVVFNAMKLYFKRNPNSDFLFVFTGKMEDYRAPEYIRELKGFFKIPEISAHAVLTGFIGREEQIIIMKNAEYMIQPSLFEGWGTVVEDAKVLDKTVLLSDIPIHREQRNGKCILFDPYSPEQMADLIEKENKREHREDIEAGILDMQKRAKEYSAGFQKILGF